MSLGTTMGIGNENSVTEAPPPLSPTNSLGLGLFSPLLGATQTVFSDIPVE